MPNLTLPDLALDVLAANMAGPDLTLAVLPLHILPADQLLILLEPDVLARNEASLFEAPPVIAALVVAALLGATVVASPLVIAQLLLALILAVPIGLLRELMRQRRAIGRASDVQHQAKDYSSAAQDEGHAHLPQSLPGNDRMVCDIPMLHCASLNDCLHLCDCARVPACPSARRGIAHEIQRNGRDA